MNYSFAVYKPHYRNLVSLGIPVVIGQLGTVILSFADTLMIGQYSTMELAAASFVNSIMNLIIFSSVGFTCGLTPLLGPLAGKQEFSKSGAMVKNSFVANTLLSVLLLACMGAFYCSMDYLGQPEELLPSMKPYFLILAFSIPFVLWFQTFKQFADGILDTKTSMWILLGGNILNIVGNYAFIYGKWGMPEMGLNGAGLATFLSRVLMFLVAVFLFMSCKRYSAYWKGFCSGVINKADLLQLNRMGWPVFLQIGMESASFSLSSIMVGWLGTIALAAHQVMLTVSQICFLVFYGMSAAVAVRVSHFHGQHDITNLRHTASAGFHLNLFLILFTAFPLFLLREHVGGWFTDSEEVSLLVAQVLLPLLVYQVGDGMQINYANSLRGIGDVKPMILYAFIAYFVISLPVGYLLGIVLNLGLIGIWFAFPFGLTTAGILYYLRFERSVGSMR